MQGRYDHYERVSCVTEIAEEKEGWYRFEDTVFYGEKGGMPDDRGTINGLVADGLRWDGEELWHHVNGTLQNPIVMELDAEYRLAVTAPQTALHILDAYYRKKGIVITSTNVNPENSYYDINTRDLPQSHLDEVQRYINHAIGMDAPVTFSYVKGSEYPDPDYAKYDRVRIVTIRGLDQQPCGTPHVNHTGEIGSFVLLRSEHISSGTRVYFACSRAADRMLSREDRLLHELAGILNTGISELPEKLEKLSENNKKQKTEIQDLLRSLCRYEAAEYAEKEPSVIDLGKNQSQKLRVFSQEYARAAKCTAIIYTAGDLTDFAIVSPDQKARDLLEALKQKIGCSGGGSPKIASGRSELGKEDFAAAAEAVMKEQKGH
ncbi:MAG: hypothetical protein ACI4WR_10400 [Bulleidia sp.]